MTSASVQNYLKAIYTLQENEATVTTSALAEHLNISAASATNMVKKLARLKLANHSPYHGVQLTPRGQRQALEVIRHHRLIELFLSETLGVPWDRVHAEAEKIEHVISEDLEDRIAVFLGDPEQDPHGDPIPTRDGVVARPEYAQLIGLGTGDLAVIRRVRAQSPGQLRELSRLGLVPGARVTLLEPDPAGWLVVQVGPGPARKLDTGLARAIWVSPPAVKAARNGKPH